MQNDGAHLTVSLARMGDRWEKAYLKSVVQQTGKSLSAIARDAQISPTTLTRPMSDPDYKFVLKLATLEKIATTTGIPLPDHPTPQRTEGYAFPESLVREAAETFFEAVPRDFYETATARDFAAGIVTCCKILQDNPESVDNIGDVIYLFSKERAR